MIKRLHI